MLFCCFGFTCCGGFWLLGWVSFLFKINLSTLQFSNCFSGKMLFRLFCLFTHLMLCHPIFSYALPSNSSFLLFDLSFKCTASLFRKLSYVLHLQSLKILWIKMQRYTEFWRQSDVEYSTIVGDPLHILFGIRDRRNLWLDSHKYDVRKEREGLPFRDYCFNLQVFFRVEIDTLE